MTMPPLAVGRRQRRRDGAGERADIVDRRKERLERIDDVLLHVAEFVEYDGPRGGGGARRKAQATRR